MLWYDRAAPRGPKAVHPGARPLPIPIPPVARTGTSLNFMISKTSNASKDRHWYRRTNLFSVCPFSRRLTWALASSRAGRAFFLISGNYFFDEVGNEVTCFLNSGQYCIPLHQFFNRHARPCKVTKSQKFCLNFRDKMAAKRVFVSDSGTARPFCLKKWDKAKNGYSLPRKRFKNAS